MSAVKNVIKDNYNMMLLNNYLKVKIKESGFSKVEVSKTPTGTRVVLYVTRPGIVIGRKGTGIRELTEKLETEFGLKNPQLSVEEIKNQSFLLELCVIEWHHILKGALLLDVQLCGPCNKLWKMVRWVHR